MRKIGLFTLLIHLIRVVHCNSGNTTTTNATHQIKLDDLVLVATLAYNKTGNINSLSWSSKRRNSASNATVAYSHHYYLVAASVTTFQIWNGIQLDTNQSDTPIDWDIIQLIPSKSIAHAASFSPNGKWLALGNDNGEVQLWSVASKPWRLLNSSVADVDGKIRSLSWHPTSLWLGVAGIEFGFVVLDVNRNWTTALIEPPSSTMPQVADTYLHFIDWSPANAFVVDTTVYELVQPRNVFNMESTSATTLVSRAIAVLEACRLCTLSQWSPDGQLIATAFGSQISISHVKVVADVQQNATGKYTSWELIHNLTTVNDTYMVITSMEWSPNGKYLAVGGAGNFNLFVYDTSSWFEEPLRIPTSTKYGIDSLAWRPDSQQIAIGTSRIIEIRRIVLKEVLVVDSSPTNTPIPYNPTSPPSEGGTLSNPPSTQLRTGIGTAGMASIGIVAVVLSFSCVAIVFLQRLKFISKRKKNEKRERLEDHEIDALREVENTMSEEDLDFSNPIDRVIIVPRTRNSHNSNDDLSLE